MSAPVYLLAGETFLAEEAIDRIRSDAGTDPLSEASFGPEVAAAELLGALDTPSLLGGRRLVVVRDAQDLGKEQVEALTRYIEAPSPSAVLVLVAGGRTKLDAAVRSAGTVLALEAPKGRRLVGWIRERGRGHNLRVDDRAGWALLDSVGTELRDLDGALSQLATALGTGATVGAAEVRKAFPRLADERVFAFQDAVGERRLAVAMTALRRLLEQGDEPLMVFGALTSQIRRMLRARRYADLNAKAVADAMGLPSWRAERLQRQCRSYREEELAEAMTVLSATDVEMKGGDIPPEAALERAVVQIVTGQMVLMS
ncbi:MAG: DNA polymerase III subunit delta [Actinomycetota bacterium]|nr:DNA polymerase III subunit delta [Actinomycetota bacterium]